MILLSTLYPADMHVYTRHFLKTDYDLEAINQIAIKKEIAYLGLTTSIDFRTQPLKDCIRIITRQNQLIDAYNARYASKILKGIEIYEPQNFRSELEQLKNSVDIDYIIGSITHLLGVPITKMKNIKNIYTLYLNYILQMLECDIDIIGHIDYILKYMQNDYLDPFLLKQVLKGIVKNKKILEINTQNYYSHHNYLPNHEIIELYHHIGGHRVTFGSSARQLDDIYRGIEPLQSEIDRYEFDNGIMIKRKFKQL